MIEYKELHLSRYFEENIALEIEIKKFVKDPNFYLKPVEKVCGGGPLEKVYNVTDPFYFDGKYWTWFDIFEMEGWNYVNTYWKNDHKVMTFIKCKEA